MKRARPGRNIATQVKQAASSRILINPSLQATGHIGAAEEEAWFFIPRLKLIALRKKSAQVQWA